MKQDISTLMDGELCDEEAESLLGKIKRHPEVRQQWVSYHLIGDALRQPDYIPRGMSPAFFERLQAEPTVLAPHSRKTSTTGIFAMSAAASVMAIAFLAWISVQMDKGQPIQQAQQSPAASWASSTPANGNMDDYLLAHHEFSPSNDVRGAASYVRTVAYRQTEAGR